MLQHQPLSNALHGLDEFAAFASIASAPTASTARTRVLAEVALHEDAMLRRKAPRIASAEGTPDCAIEFLLSTRIEQAFDATKDGRKQIHSSVCHGRDSCCEGFLREGSSSNRCRYWPNIGHGRGTDLRPPPPPPEPDPPPTAIYSSPLQFSDSCEPDCATPLPASTFDACTTGGRGGDEEEEDAR